MKDAKDRVTQELPVVGKRRPGRQRTSPLTPKEQNAAAQNARRARMVEAGFAWRGFWLDQSALAALVDLKRALGADSLDEALQRLLAAAGDPRVRVVLDPNLQSGDQQSLPL